MITPANARGLSFNVARQMPCGSDAGTPVGYTRLTLGAHQHAPSALVHTHRVFDEQGRLKKATNCDAVGKPFRELCQAAECHTEGIGFSSLRSTLETQCWHLHDLSVANQGAAQLVFPRRRCRRRGRAFRRWASAGRRTTAGYGWPSGCTQPGEGRTSRPICRFSWATFSLSAATPQSFASASSRRLWRGAPWSPVRGTLACASSRPRRVP